MFFFLIKTQQAISLANAATNKLVGVGTLASISASAQSNFQCQQSSSDEQISSQDFHQTFLFLMPFCFWSQEKLSPWPLSTTSLPLLAYGINLSPPPSPRPHRKVLWTSIAIAPEAILQCRAQSGSSNRIHLCARIGSGNQILLHFSLCKLVHSTSVCLSRSVIRRQIQIISDYSY